MKTFEQYINNEEQIFLQNRFNELVDINKLIIIFDFTDCDDSFELYYVYPDSFKKDEYYSNNMYDKILIYDKTDYSLGIEIIIHNKLIGKINKTKPITSEESTKRKLLASIIEKQFNIKINNIWKFS